MSQASKQSGNKSKGPILWPLALVAVGVILLFNNFLLLGDFNVSNLAPLILVVIGAWILLRGDIVPSDDQRTIGITRGSVESATLDIRAGEIDVSVSMLPASNQERLIAFRSYPSQSRPELKVDGVHTRLVMHRNHTPWFSYTDWDMLIAQGLPWQFFISSHLGQVNLDLAEGIIWNARIATGIGDIFFTPPYESLENIHLSSTIGDIHIQTPQGYATHIYVQKGRLFDLHVDQSRYEQVAENEYISRHPDEEAPIVAITVRGTFGDAYLA